PLSGRESPRPASAMSPRFAPHASVSLLFALLAGAGCKSMAEPSPTPPRAAGSAAMSNPSPVEQVQTQLMLAQSDAKVERDEAVSWLLAHPNEAAPVVERAVRDGTAPDPRLYLSLLGHYARAEDVAAIEAALRRGVPGESFYAAAALASNGTDAARQAMLRGLEHENPMIRGAIADALVDP